MSRIRVGSRSFGAGSIEDRASMAHGTPSHIATLDWLSDASPDEQGVLFELESGHSAVAAARERLRASRSRS